MKSAEAIQQHVKAIAVAHADFAKASLEQSKTYVEQLAQVKSIDQAIEAHAQYYKIAFDTFLVEATKLGDLYKQVAKDAFAPWPAVFDTKSAASSN